MFTAETIFLGAERMSPFRRSDKTLQTKVQIYKRSKVTAFGANFHLSHQNVYGDSLSIAKLVKISFSQLIQLTAETIEIAEIQT